MSKQKHVGSFITKTPQSNCKLPPVYSIFHASRSGVSASPRERFIPCISSTVCMLTKCVPVSTYYISLVKNTPCSSRWYRLISCCNGSGLANYRRGKITGAGSATICIALLYRRRMPLMQSGCGTIVAHWHGSCRLYNWLCSYQTGVINPSL